jgi:hypothetical protein
VFGLEVAVLQGAEVEAEALATRRERQCRQHGDFLSAAAADLENRCLTAGRERSPHQRVQQDAALVDEDNGGPLAARPF